MARFEYGAFSFYAANDKDQPAPVCIAEKV
jgi:hypothetical protein